MSILHYFVIKYNSQHLSIICLIPVWSRFSEINHYAGNRDRLLTSTIYATDCWKRIMVWRIFKGTLSRVPSMRTKINFENIREQNQRDSIWCWRGYSWLATSRVNSLGRSLHIHNNRKCQRSSPLSSKFSSSLCSNIISLSSRVEPYSSLSAILLHRSRARESDAQR